MAHVTHAQNSFLLTTRSGCASTCSYHSSACFARRYGFHSLSRDVPPRTPSGEFKTIKFLSVDSVPSVPSVLLFPLFPNPRDPFLPCCPWLNLIRADALSAGRDAYAPSSVALFEGSVILTNETQGSLTLTLGYTLSPLRGSIRN